jgi:hypothetical protein
MKHKVIICFFGVVSRSIKFTYKNLNDKLINIVKQNYDVDIYIFNNNVKNEIIDGIQQNNDDVELLQRTFIEEKTQCDIDNEINNQITSKNIICEMRHDYDKNTIINAIRQMYSEHQVGLFLEKYINDYKCAIVCGPDYYLLNNVNLEDIKNSINNDTIVYTTRVNDAQGYTNGFYIGSLKPIIKILKRYSILEQLLPTDKDYEYLLKKSFEINKINRIITDTLFVKIRSNKHIARQGIMLDNKYTNIINNIINNINNINNNSPLRKISDESNELIIDFNTDQQKQLSRNDLNQNLNQNFNIDMNDLKKKLMYELQRNI